MLTSLATVGRELVRSHIITYLRSSVCTTSPDQEVADLLYCAKWNGLPIKISYNQQK
ncbi:hypothetical protein J6590_067080 [Homalodisca vitripennis]|nr:hypothetical protein J6590_067080 [Homalodisca vitripennis]